MLRVCMRMINKKGCQGSDEQARCVFYNVVKGSYKLML